MAARRPASPREDRRGVRRLPLRVVLAAFVVSLAQPLVGQTPAPGPSEQAASKTPAAPEPVDRSAAPEETQAQPELVEDIVDQALRLADLPSEGNTPVHFAIAAILLLLALALRRTIVRWVFALLMRLARRTSTTLDDCLLPPLERSLKSLVILVGIAGALSVLKLPPAAERALQWGYIIAFSLVALTFALRLVDTFLDVVEARASKRHLSMAAFMPWIRRVVLAVILVFGVLMIAQSLGANVRAFLAGLGIGGLAVALAAQDTLANILGSIVIAVDQPFRVGEFVQIGPNAGTVEDIGLRSTRLRTAQKNLIIIPNRTVAAEPVVNLSRFIQRRVEQTFRLNHDATPEQLEQVVENIRSLVLAEEQVDRSSVIVQFTDFGASSLDVWLVYNTHDSDFVKHLQLKQRLNLAIMRAVAARGLRFALPTQRLHVDDTPARHAPGEPERA